MPFTSTPGKVRSRPILGDLHCSQVFRRSLPRCFRPWPDPCPVTAATRRPGNGPESYRSDVFALVALAVATAAWPLRETRPADPLGCTDPLTDGCHSRRHRWHRRLSLEQRRRTRWERHRRDPPRPPGADLWAFSSPFLLSSTPASCYSRAARSGERSSHGSTS
jgi:hypothetical protein